MIGVIARLCELADQLMVDGLLEHAVEILEHLGDPVGPVWQSLEVDDRDKGFKKPVDGPEIPGNLFHFVEAVYMIVPDNEKLRSKVVRMGYDFC
jgi:hypothetical protein